MTACTFGRIAGERASSDGLSPSVPSADGRLPKNGDQGVADFFVLRGSEAVENRGQGERIGLRQMLARDLEELLPVGCRAADDACRRLAQDGVGLRRSARCQKRILVGRELRPPSDQDVKGGRAQLIGRFRIGGDGSATARRNPGMRARADQFHGARRERSRAGYRSALRRDSSTDAGNSFSRMPSIVSSRKTSLLLTEAGIGEKLSRSNSWAARWR